MACIFDAAFNCLLQIAKCTDYIKIGVIICLVSVTLSSFSVSIKTAVYGYPKVSGGVLILYFLISLFIYALAVIDCIYGNKYFQNLGYAFIYLVAVIFSITGLYAAFYHFAEKNYNKKVRKKEELCVAFSKALATVEEVILDIKNGTEETFDNNVCDDNDFYGKDYLSATKRREDDKNIPIYKLKTEKLCYKKPRLDDDINYRKVEKYFEDLLKENLSPIEKATLKVLYAKIKSYKNVELTDQIRLELCDAFTSFIKIRSKNGGINDVDF